MFNSVLQSIAHINNSYLNVALIQSEDSSVSIVNGLAGPMDLIPGTTGSYLFTPTSIQRYWGLPSILFSGHVRLFLSGKT